MYRKRSRIKEFWSIPKKGTKYIASATHHQENSIPLVVVMRDMMKLVRNRRELREIINGKMVMINGKEIKETNYPVCLFDILTLKDLNRSYRAVILGNRKMALEEIPEKEAAYKIFKVINKKTLPGKKIQLNLIHGVNIISNEKVKIGDSVVLLFKDKKITRIIPMEKGRRVVVMEGKHTGNQGKVEEIVVRGNKEIAKIKSDKEKINVWVKNIIAVE